MKNYFSSIDLVHGTYIGTVYDSSNNQEVYKTPSYGDQSQALQDINNFLSSSITSIDELVPTTNTFEYTITPVRRCCGG